MKKCLLILSLFSFSLLSACGGGENSSTATTTSSNPNMQTQSVLNSQEVVFTTTVANFPHQVDFYLPSHPTTALVILHGGGGSKTGVSYSLGMNSNRLTATPTTVNWAWMEKNNTMLIFPQGQYISSAPNTPTWSNYTMTSGQDDKAFLENLSSYILTHYPNINKLGLMGHSMGGAMTNRMWCESSNTFDFYVGVAGPASNHFNYSGSTPCTPVSAHPYLSISGNQDQVMQTSNGNWSQSTWTIDKTQTGYSPAYLEDPSVMIGEWFNHLQKSNLMCQETNDLVQPISVSGNVSTWSNCSSRLVIKRINGATHDLSSITTQIGSGTTGILDNVIDFANKLPYYR